VSLRQLCNVTSWNTGWYLCSARFVHTVSRYLNSSHQILRNVVYGPEFNEP